MKTARKWLALALCLTLALGFSVTAFAANTTDPKDIAREFMSLLKADGVEYEDVGPDEDGNYEIHLYYEGTNLDEHFIVLSIDSDGQDYGIYEWYLLDYEDSRFFEVLKTVNSLNMSYRHVTFLADTSDNTITAKYSGSLQGNAKQCAAILHYAYDWLPIMVDRLWPTLEAGVLGTGVDPEDADFVDSWYFSSLVYTEDADGVSAGTEVTAEDVDFDSVVITFKSNGDAIMTLMGEEYEGSWEQDGVILTLTDDTGENILVTMTDEDTISVDASETAGYIMTMVREGSQAYKALAA